MPTGKTGALLMQTQSFDEINAGIPESPANYRRQALIVADACLCKHNWVHAPNDHCGIVDVGPSDFTQFWTSSPDTRWNSRSLFVTRISLAALACAAIHRSLFPMTRPLASSSARRAP